MGKVEIEQRYREGLDKLLEEYDKGDSTISELASKNRNLAEQMCREHDYYLSKSQDIVDREIYGHLKWIGWEKINNRFKRDEKLISEEEQVNFFAEFTCYSIENDLI